MTSSAANTNNTDDGNLSESSSASSYSILITQQQHQQHPSNSINIFNCTTNEEQQAKAIKDGNDAVLKQFEIKKIQMEYSKGQARSDNKPLSSMNISIANVDWSGFSGAAHNSIRSIGSATTNSTNNNKSSHRKTAKSRRKSLQSKSPYSSTNSVPEKNEQTNTNPSTNDTDSTTSTSARIEKLRSSRQRQLVADKDGSANSSSIRTHRTTSSENPFGRSANTNTNAEQRQKRCMSRRSTSRRNLIADLTPLPSSSSSHASNVTNSTRGTSRSIKTKPKTPSPSALASKLNSANNGSSRSRSRSSITGVSIHSRDLAAASTTFEISKRRSSLKSKSFSRQRRQEDVMGSELKKQSSIKW